MGKLYAGIHFIKTADSGMAKISLYNTTKNEWVFQDKIVDLYTSATNDPEDFLYWVSLPYADDEYEFTVVHSTYHNVSAISPYNINIDSYFTIENIYDSDILTKIILKDSNNGQTYEYEINDNESIDLELNKTFVGDGVETEFKIDNTTNCYPYEFLKVSPDGGTNWYYPEDFRIEWGSNSPDYNNETINDGFTIIFNEAPADGNEIIIKFKPLFDKYKVYQKLIQPSDDLNFVEYGFGPRLIDFGIEFK